MEVGLGHYLTVAALLFTLGKFLIGRDGKLNQRYGSKVAPESSELTEAIEAALKQK